MKVRFFTTPNRSIMRYAIGLMFFGALLYTNCTDPTTLGADLFEEDQADIFFTDSLTIQASTEPGDSVLTYNPSNFSKLNSFLFGQMEDPLLGLSKASIYIQPRLESNNPNFFRSNIDSIVLVLPYDTSNVYGNISEEFAMEVFRLTEAFDEGSLYYSNRALQTEMTALNSEQNQSFKFSADSLNIISFDDNASRETITVPPQLRLNLNQTFGEELLNAPESVYESDTAFINNILSGLYLKPTAVTGGVLSFDLNNNSEAGIYLYYHRLNHPDSAFQFHYELDVFSAIFERFEHDYEGSFVESRLGDVKAGEETVFVQGMSGVKTKIEIPYVYQLDNIAVNKAELEITIKTLDEDNTGQFPPVEEMALLYEENGVFTLVSDLAIANDPSALLSPSVAFGGILIDRIDEPSVYRMNISTHLQEMINREKPRAFYLAVSNPPQNPSRTTLFGPGDPVYGMKINLAYTELNK